MSVRFACVIPVVESFSSDLLQAIISYCEESHLETCQSSLSLNTLTIFSKKPHCRGSRCGVGRLQVHGICSCRLVHSEVVEA